jgi:hypothetical protein
VFRDAGTTRYAEVGCPKEEAFKREREIMLIHAEQMVQGGSLVREEKQHTPAAGQDSILIRGALLGFATATPLRGFLLFGGSLQADEMRSAFALVFLGLAAAQNASAPLDSTSVSQSSSPTASQTLTQTATPTQLVPVPCRFSFDSQLCPAGPPATGGLGSPCYGECRLFITPFASVDWDVALVVAVDPSKSPASTPLCEMGTFCRATQLGQPDPVLGYMSWSGTCETGPTISEVYQSGCNPKCVAAVVLRACL